MKQSCLLLSSKSLSESGFCHAFLGKERKQTARSQSCRQAGRFSVPFLCTFPALPANAGHMISLLSLKPEMKRSGQ